MTAMVLNGEKVQKNLSQCVYLGLKIIVFLKFFWSKNIFFVEEIFQMKYFATCYLSYLQLLQYVTCFVLIIF
jgi:hypothetical protein